MRAVICTAYGDPSVLKVINIDKPTPKAKEVLVKVYATSVNSGDVRIRKLDVPMGTKLIFRLIMGFTRPRNKVLGSTVAGIIEQVGNKVTRFKVGDKVFGINGLRFGAYAQYMCLPEKAALTIMPKNISFEQAAPLPFGAMTALHILRTGKIKSGTDVLIYGASGAVGTYAVQIVKAYGTSVTAVCGPSNGDLLKTIGADKVIDYHKGDFTKTGGKYDVIMDAVGKTSKKACAPLLKQGGTYLSVKSPTSETTEMLVAIRKLVEAGKLVTVIDHTYDINGIQNAHAYAETGHKRGNVVITMVQNGEEA